MASVSFSSVSNISLQNAFSLPATLKAGDTVRVRVVGLQQGGYVVSFGGARFSVSSNRPLEIGSSFTARIGLSPDGKVILEPEAAEKQLGLNSGFASLLESAEFASNPLASGLFQMMHQMGMKIDFDRIKKFSQIGLRFPGKEAAASQVAMLLEQKGIEPTEENIMHYLLMVDPDGGQDAFEFNSPGNEKKDTELDGGFLERMFGPVEFPGEGLLTFANQVRNREGSGHWIMLPFEWNSGRENYVGNISILMNLDLRKTEKIQILCKTTCKKYSFIVYFKDNKVKEVRFCSLPPLLTSQIRKEEMRIGELFCSGMNGNSVPVTYSSLALIDGICSPSDFPESFETFV